MFKHKKGSKPAKMDRSLTATGLEIVAIAVLLIFAYFQINAVLRDRSMKRMEEGVNTVIEEVTAKLERDSRILNATAQTISQTDNFDAEAMLDVVESNAPLLETMRVNILMPGDKILSPDGSVTDAGGDDNISFAEEAAKGEHISNRTASLIGGRPVLRHYVPIIQDGQTAALVYGVTELDSLHNSLNIDNIYNASANVYIIDTSTGDFILDTFHDELGNITQYAPEVSPRETKGAKDWNSYTEEMLNLKTGYVVFRTPQTDGWEYMYYAPAEINDWEIAVSVPEKEAFTSVFAVQRICLYLGIFMAITIILYYIWVSRNAKRVMQKAVEQAVLEEKLHKAEAAEKAKTMFLSNMSHDIRTPMNAIIGFATLAQTNLDNTDKVKEYLTKILSSSNHLLSLINDILDMSRIESGRLNIEEKECSISDIFKDMRNIIQTQMQEKRLNFFMDTIDVVDEDIYCDKLHVNQVLLNLLSNAIKFTPAGGSVSLTIRQKPGAPDGYGAYEIRVKDTGIGMSDEFARHVFEPFEREATSTVSGIQGTGLGMAITKSIVETMGGTIEVNTEQNRGTEFIINIEFRLQHERKQIEIVRELEGLRVLVVDDSFDTCDSVTKMLMQIGMRSEWTLHGHEAVLRARQAVEVGDEFYAYIIDWALPDMNGIEVARRIRSIAGKNVPIIVLTAYDWSIFEEEAREAGVTSFCNKPIFISELRDTLVSAINKTDPVRKESPIPKTAEELIGKRLLLVEDNDLNREIAEEILKESGFVVETAHDGTEAVDMVKKSKPGYYDLVLMDVQMPVMNGYDATRAIRSLDNKDLASVPIVAMTANAFEEDKKTALESGMNAHIAKPIELNKLVKVLNDLLSK